MAAVVFADPPAVAEANEKVAHDLAEQVVGAAQGEDLLVAPSWPRNATWVNAMPSTTAAISRYQESPIIAIAVQVAA